MLGIFKAFLRNKTYKKPVTDNLPTGCIYCRQFNGRGCNLTKIEFWDGMNVAVRPKGCPLVAGGDKNENYAN